MTPIGTTYRDKPIGLVGLNCAVCHVGTYRSTASSPRQIVLGMPSNRMRLWDYIQFLRKAERDKRFNADTLLAAIDRRFPGQALVPGARALRYVGYPQSEDGRRKADRDFAWLDSRPPYGPGRVDTFNPLKQRAGFDMKADHTIGTVDFPSIWDQRERLGMHLHWDGNNTSLQERNISAARAVGGTDDSLDIHQLDRIANWLLDLRPPAFPSKRIDRPLERQGQRIYDQQCASCHDIGGALVGTGDADRPDRDRPEPPRLVHACAGHRARHERRQGEAVALPHFPQDARLRQLTARRALAARPVPAQRQRPDAPRAPLPGGAAVVFYTGYDVYDWKNVGFVSSGPAARREGFRYDTRVRGNGNEGHMYGTDLPAAQRLAIIEYLKTK